jgi:isopropylmalate/homocitrate/citramalate synthase
MAVTVCDVDPRDGLQNEPEVLAPSVRAELVNKLASALLPRIEAASFVRAETGNDLDALVATSEWLEGALGRRLEGHVYRAGAWAGA